MYFGISHKGFVILAFIVKYCAMLTVLHYKEHLVIILIETEYSTQVLML